MRAARVVIPMTAEGAGGLGERACVPPGSRGELAGKRAKLQESLSSPYKVYTGRVAFVVTHVDDWFVVELTTFSVPACTR